LLDLATGLEELILGAELNRLCKNPKIPLTSLPMATTSLAVFLISTKDSLACL